MSGQHLMAVQCLQSHHHHHHHPFHGKMDYCCTIIAFMFLKTMPFIWNFYNNTMIHLSQAIMALLRPLNCCHAITGIPTCMLTSSPTSPPVNYAPEASHHVISNMASSHRSLFPP